MDAPQVLFDRYHFARDLSNKGGFADTYVYQDTHLHGEEVVVKVLRTNTTPQALKYRELFEREGEILHKLKNKGAFPEAKASPPGEPVHVMEYIPGKTLDEELAGLLPVGEVYHLLEELLEVVVVLQHHGIIHRDLSPRNFIRRDQPGHALHGKLHLIDFGLAREGETRGEPDDRSKTMAYGTEAYASPEQSYGDAFWTSDLYAVGRIALRAWLGRANLPRREKDFDWQPPVQPGAQALAPFLKSLTRVDHEKRAYQNAQVALDTLKHLQKTPRPASVAAPETTSVVQTARPAPTPAAKPSTPIAVAKPVEVRQPSFSIPRWLWGGGAVIITVGITAAILSNGAREAIAPTPSPGLAAGSSLSKSKFVKGSRKTRKGGALMAFVPGGTYTRRDTKQKVTLADFWMDMTPVTVAQYRAYCKATGKPMPKEKPSWGWLDEHPMVNVNWNDAMAYAKWAGGRLPTSGESEYAARNGGENIAYPWGDTFDTDKLWCSVKKLNDAGKTAPVNRKNRIFTNSLGLSDMAGNVWQWCSDGPESATRYLSGGSWDYNTANKFRCAFRDSNDPAGRYDDFGFRVSSPG